MRNARPNTQARVSGPTAVPTRWHASAWSDDRRGARWRVRGQRGVLVDSRDGEAVGDSAAESRVLLFEPVEVGPDVVLEKAPADLTVPEECSGEITVRGRDAFGFGQRPPAQESV